MHFLGLWAAAPVALVATLEPPSYEACVGYWSTINDAGAAHAARLAAEEQLSQAVDIRCLALVFADLDDAVPKLVGQADNLKSVLTPPADIISTTPGLGSAAADQVLPASAQVVYARLRIWLALCSQVGAPQDRQTWLVDALREKHSDFEYSQLIQAAEVNWSEELRVAVLTLFRDRTKPPMIRSQAGKLLAKSAARDQHPTRRTAIEDVIRAAWDDRGSHVANDVAISLRSIGHKDARVVTMLIDRYRGLQQRNADLDQRVRALEYVERCTGKTFAPSATDLQPRSSEAWKAQFIHRGEEWLSEKQATWRAAAVRAGQRQQ